MLQGSKRNGMLASDACNALRYTYFRIVLSEYLNFLQKLKNSSCDGSLYCSGVRLVDVHDFTFFILLCPNKNLSEENDGGETKDRMKGL